MPAVTVDLRGVCAAGGAPLSATSLSKACEAFLGRPLLKTEQTSDWDRRPLSPAQLQYAALDAHASLALLDVALERVLGGGDVDVGGAARYYRQPVERSN
jgi:ribonuclease D